MAVFAVQPLPDLPSEAAAAFHLTFLPRAHALLSGGATCLTLLFAAADHTHRTWRLAAVQALAREYAPARVNALSGGDEAAIAAALAYLEAAEGVTGQFIPLAEQSAGPVLQSRT